MEEIFKPIIGYIGSYEISNFGRVKSLKRTIIYPDDRTRKLQERILSAGVNSNGYLGVRLYDNYKAKWYKIHLLVWDAFGDGQRDGRKIQVDHIDENKLNNRLDNLQLLTNRQNCSKGKSKDRDFPTGVYPHKNGKYAAEIQINGKKKYIGFFNCPTAASLAYQKELIGVTI